MQEGAVKWYDERKGFGYIREVAGLDVFVHRSSFLDGLTTLTEGDRVRFDLNEGARKLEAMNVVKIS